MAATTYFPAVFIHGTLGWGRRTPFFNLAPNYWPLKQLDDVNPNHIVVEVGIASSDHDRACETFYQLIGGRVDYGEAHAAEKGHLRYGATFDTALHPTWSEDNPVHLVGHSYGATTALELYQLLCVDFFGIGSNYKWVKSIVSISGTLSGTTMGSMFGSTLGNPSPYGSISYLIACGFATLHKLQQHVPWLSNLYDLRMPQWAHASSSSWRTLYDPAHKPLNTDDNVFTCLLPQHRLAKNERLVHMDKIHLFSIVSQTTNVLTYPPVVEFATIAAICTMWKLQKPKLWIGLLSLWLCRRLTRVDWSKPSLFLGYLMKRHAEKADAFYEGYDKDDWQHSDGVVNSYSMIRPRLSFAPPPPLEEPPEEGTPAVMVRVPSHVSIDMGVPDELNAVMISTGQWHVYRVNKNHLCGTRGDGDARELYTRLFRLLNQISGTSPCDTILPLPPTQLELGFLTT